MRLLLEAGAAVNTEDAWCATPLLAAAAAGCAGCVRRLLESAANARLVDDHYDSALTLAREAGHEDCADLLMEALCKVSRDSGRA